MKDMKALHARLSSEEYCYLTTTGRISGHPHEIEIWFGINENVLYLLSGGGENSDWVKNMRANSSVTVRIGKHTFTGTARLALDAQEEAQARRMLAAKYQGWHDGGRLSNWARTALPVAINLAV